MLATLAIFLGRNLVKSSTGYVNQLKASFIQESKDRWVFIQLDSYEVYDPNAEVVIKVEAPVQTESAIKIFDIKPKGPKSNRPGPSGKQ